MLFNLDKLQGKPLHQAAVFGVIAFALCFAFYYFVTSPVREATAETVAQVDKLKGENAVAQVNAQRINEFRLAHTQAQADYEELKALLPEQRELTNVLQGLQERAHGRMVVRRFTPKEDVQQDFYSGKPMEVEVSGSYNNLGAFFADMAAYQRIVSITDFKVGRAAQQGAGRTIDAQFLLTAYYVPADKLQAVPAKPGAKPAAATPTATPAAVASNASATSTTQVN